MRKLKLILIPLIALSISCTKMKSGVFTSAEQALNSSEDQIAEPSPSIIISSPIEGATVNGVIQLVANVTARSQVASVTFRWDSVELQNPVLAAPYSYSWDTTKHVDGLYTLTAVARDQKGASFTSPPVTVRIVNRVISPTPNPEPMPQPQPIPTTPQPLPMPTGTIRRVPQDFTTIQAAVNAASNGDTILISPGTYKGGISVSGKALIIASTFLTTGIKSQIEQTIIKDGNPMLSINTAGTKVIGLTFTGDLYGVSLYAYGEIINCRFIDIGADSVSFEEASGVVRDSVFIDPGDDAIDGDGPHNVLIENNEIRNADDDGIEIRNFNHTGETYTVVIRGNRIYNSGEDGIQLIDYSGTANRVFVIEKNLIVNSAYVGLGLMSDGNTIEDFQGASMPERIHVLNNTFHNNRYGITGGDNMAVINNIISNSSMMGLKNVDGNSIAAYNLFFGNQLNSQSSNIDLSKTFTGDPRYTNDFKLMSGSAAIGVGVSNFNFRGQEISNLSRNLGSMEAQ